MRNIDLVQLAIQGWKTDRDPVTDWDASFSPDLENFTPVKSGILRMVKGYERLAGPVVGATVAPMVCLFGAVVADLTSDVTYNVMIYSGSGDLIAQELTTAANDNLAGGNTVYTYSMGGSAVLVDETADADTYYEFAGVIANYIYFSNGAKNYRVWRDTTWQIEEVDGSTKPAANYIPRVWLQRLWLGGGLPRTIIYGETDADIDDFPAANKMALSSPGGNFASMEVWERDLFVFFDSNIACIPFALDPADYHEIDMATGWGCAAPYTLRRCGMHGLVCLSNVGVMAWPSQQELSGAIEESLTLIHEDAQARHRLRAAYAFYNPVDDTYNLQISTPGGLSGTSYRNNEWWKYYFQTQRWIKVDAYPWNSIGNVIDFGPAGMRVITGTYEGYLYWHGNSDGAGADRHDGTITNVVSSTVFDDSAAAFTTAGQGLDNFPVYIISGTAAGQRRRITSNTATQITVATATSPAWVAGDAYIVCAQRGKFVTPWLHMGDPHKQKRFVEVRFSVDPDAVDKDYEIKLYRDFGTSAFKTLRGTFHAENCIVPLDARCVHLKIEINVITNDDQPAFRAIRLLTEAGTYG